MLDYYLSDEGKQYLPDIHRLAKEDTDEADDKLLHYVMEGIRLNGTFSLHREATVETTIDDNGKPIHVKAGDKVFCNFVSSSFHKRRGPFPLLTTPRSAPIAKPSTSRTQTRCALIGQWIRTSTMGKVLTPASVNPPARSQ